ncbi:hypothetical protein HNY73_012980 [Argiope bruennichi]|uniref:PiggyBac transposable element-derived protein domain-containing protein n=1 Tax=Argiope bruennichi TaxID=94029 RepID=A0A8T0F2H5_ARGBR|nr:hypothetical protein HNY73_012980 [Argiope bruennichi]
MSRRKGLSVEEALCIFENLPSDDSDTPIESSSDEDEATPSTFTPLATPSTSQTNVEVAESESSSDEEDIQRIWRKRNSSTTVPIFSLNFGFVSSHFDSLSSPVDFFLKFFDNDIIENIIFQSNLYSNQTVKRTQKDGTKLDVPTPTILKVYNEQMGGVDKADMLRSLYN